MAFEVSGRLEDKRIREASGLARSYTVPGRLWIINDNGAKEWLHAIDASGRRLGEFDLKKSRNRDWEDLASFVEDDVPYLMVADIGDNDAKRGQRTLYFVAEPDTAYDAKIRSWQVDYRYPDGPRDAEAAAVDTQNEVALVLSKRDLPPQLYSVPLRTTSDDPVTANKLGAITSLAKPSRNDLAYAIVRKDWYWQPVAMDIAADNRAAVIITYRTLYYFERQAEQSWLDALNSAPVTVSLGNFKNAESVAFMDDGRNVMVTGENKHSRILTIDLSGVAKQ